MSDLRDPRTLDAALAWRAHRLACTPCNMAESGLTNTCSEGRDLIAALLRARRAARQPSRA